MIFLKIKNNLLKSWRNMIRDRRFIKSTIISFLFLFSSIIINFIAGTYATEKASLPVTDIILSNIRVYNVGSIFIFGPIILFIFIVILLIYNPKKIPFSIKSLALFVIIRSIFISLTHIVPFPTMAVVNTGELFNKFTFGGDLFFSGHTGVPYLFSLIFWENKYLRYILITTAIFFGIVVLMGHLHYSIDVLAAFFITYTIFHISKFLFNKDTEYD